MIDPYPLDIPPHLQKQIDLDSSGLDVMHGHLKELLYEAEQELEEAQRVEDETEEAIDSMERKYWEGQVDALSYLYSLTYALSFGIAAREEDTYSGQG
jgi:hypothetical protein